MSTLLSLARGDTHTTANKDTEDGNSTQASDQQKITKQTEVLAKSTPVSPPKNHLEDYNKIKKMAGGKLKVKVLNGRSLQNKETFQTSDPYCMVEVGPKSEKTKHLSSNLNPDWNEEFIFDVSAGVDVIALSVWDKNTLKKDNFMGYSYVCFEDCKKGQPTPKSARMMGGCDGQINLIITPEFETSASKMDQMDSQIKQASNDNAKSLSDIAGLNAQVGRMSEENDRFTANNKKLEEENNRFSANNEKLEQENKKFEENNNRLESSVNKLEGENKKFEENNAKLEANNKMFEENNKKLEANVNKLEGENKKFEENNKKMEEENNKFQENNKKLEAEVGRLGGEINKMTEENNKFAANNQKLEENVSKLEGEVNKMGELNKEYEANNKKLEENVNKLEGEVNKMTEENNKFQENNKKLEEQVGNLTGEVTKMTEENNKFAANNEKLEGEVNKMGEENNKLEANNKDLSDQIARLKAEIDRMAEENKKFAENNENLKKEVDRITGENNKFAENNKVLQEQNNVFIENNTKLTSTVNQLEAQANKFKEIYEKLLKENEKLARIRDGLQEQLEGFQKLQEMIFTQLNEKMRAMDRSLLEKVAADIEMMDDDQGLSRDEFARFMKRVPTHLKDKFVKIADDFKKFDQNKDNVIDSDEFGAMLDQVMKESDPPKGASSDEER